MRAHQAVRPLLAFWDTFQLAHPVCTPGSGILDHRYSYILGSTVSHGSGKHPPETLAGVCRNRRTLDITPRFPDSFTPASAR